LQSNHPF
jgi:hypothetical protein